MFLSMTFPRAKSTSILLRRSWPCYSIVWWDEDVISGAIDVFRKMINLSRLVVLHRVVAWRGSLQHAASTRTTNLTHSVLNLLMLLQLLLGNQVVQVRAWLLGTWLVCKVGLMRWGCVLLEDLLVKIIVIDGFASLIKSANVEVWKIGRRLVEIVIQWRRQPTSEPRTSHVLQLLIELLVGDDLFLW